MDAQIVRLDFGAAAAARTANRVVTGQYNLTFTDMEMTRLTALVGLLGGCGGSDQSGERKTFEIIRAGDAVKLRFSLPDGKSFLISKHPAPVSVNYGLYEETGDDLRRTLLKPQYEFEAFMTLARGYFERHYPSPAAAPPASSPPAAARS